MSTRKYWMATISKEHAMRGTAGGFIQVCHGKEGPLKRMYSGDGIIIYSPKQTMEGDEKCQSFTAIGTVGDDTVYPLKMSETFVPFRRNINFTACDEIRILPLIPALEFIPDKKRWGYPFRFGFFEIGEHDFRIISNEMLKNKVHG